MIDGKDVGVRPGLVPTKCWHVYHDTFSAVTKVDDILFPPEVVGSVVDSEDRVIVEGIVLDEYWFSAILVREQSVTEVSEQ